MKSYNGFPVLSGHNLKPPLQLPSPKSSWHKGLHQIKSLFIIYPTSWMNSSSLSYMVDFCYPISISLLLVGASQFCWKNIPFFHWLSFSGTTKVFYVGILLKVDRLDICKWNLKLKQKDWKWLEWIHPPGVAWQRWCISSLHPAALELPSFYLSVPTFQVSLRFYTLLHVPTVCF